MGDYSLLFSPHVSKVRFLGDMRVPNVRYDVFVNTTPKKVLTRIMLADESEMSDDDLLRQEQRPCLWKKW
jgi:hypothetical protein